MKVIARIALSLYIVIVCVQSLYLKFTDAPGMLYIFSTLGEWAALDWITQYGAEGVGIIELVAASLLLFGFRFEGALLAVGAMAGAIFFHLYTPLGISMPTFDAEGTVIGNDDGLLFYNTCVALVAAVLLLLLELLDRRF